GVRPRFWSSRSSAWCRRRRRPAPRLGSTTSSCFRRRATARRIGKPAQSSCCALARRSLPSSRPMRSGACRSSTPGSSASRPMCWRGSPTTGSLAVNHPLGFTGAGVGVAVIDSGIVSWHDDLIPRTLAQYPFGYQRVAAFVDFVGGGTSPYDDNGHGSHVAGIIAGNGYDSNGQKAGVAPDADLISLKVLDGAGRGNISNVIAALDWVLAHHAEHNIRVVNLSVGAAVHESYLTDPLTLAAK